MPTPSQYTKQQNRLRALHPDVIAHRLAEADRYEAYERNVLARNWSAAASPRFLDHFNSAPHKLHMVSSCIEEVTRAVERLQHQQQSAGSEAKAKVKNPFASQDQKQLEEHQSKVLQHKSGRSNIQGPSTTQKLFLLNNNSQRHEQQHIQNQESENEQDTNNITHHRNQQQQQLTAEEIVTGRRSRHNQPQGAQSSLSHSSTGATVSSSSSSSRRSPTSYSNDNQNSNNNNDNQKSSKSFFSDFDDPTRKFRFKPVELAEAMGECDVHPLPRPPLFSRPSRGQTVVVGGDIRLIGRSANVDKLSNPHALAAAAVQRDPKMLAVRIAVEQNPLHNAIEQMRQVTAAMAVKTYNAVNAMTTIMRDADRAREEEDENFGRGNEMISAVRPVSGRVRSRFNNFGGGARAAGEAAREVWKRQQFQKRCRNPTSLTQALRGRSSSPPQVRLPSREGSARRRAGGGGGGRSNVNNINKFNQNQKNPSTPRTVMPGLHLGNEELGSTRPPTREQQSTAVRGKRSNNVRVVVPASPPQPQPAVSFSGGSVGGGGVSSRAPAPPREQRSKPVAPSRRAAANEEEEKQEEENETRQEEEQIASPSPAQDVTAAAAGAAEDAAAVAEAPPAEAEEEEAEAEVENENKEAATKTEQESSTQQQENETEAGGGAASGEAAPPVVVADDAEQTAAASPAEEEEIVPPQEAEKEEEEEAKPVVANEDKEENIQLPEHQEE